MMAFFFRSASVMAFAVCVLPFPVSAQPVVTSADAPVPGASYPYVKVISFSGQFHLNWTTSGPDQEWYYPFLLEDGGGPIGLVDPASTACADTFAMADVAIRRPGSFTEFDSISDQAVYIVGECEEQSDMRRIYQGPVRPMIWPCTFMSAWSDAFSWYAPSTDMHGIGFRYDTADGYGTLVLPWGTVPDILAVREVDTTFVFPSGGDPVQYVRWTRRFVRPGWPVDIARFWSYGPDSLGLYPGELGGGYLDEGVFAAIADQQHIPTMPVTWDPVTGLLTLGLPSGTIGEAAVIDAAGRVALRTVRGDPPIMAGALADGVYTVRFTDRATGRVLAGRFVKCGW